jgi:hypothetical protein
MSTPTDRALFRQTVAQVAERAKAILPQEANGRIESATKLVLMGDVEPQADGTIHVGSSSDPSKTYQLVGHACDCQDFTHKAPDGWCCHRIAAGIAKRVGELLPPPSPEVIPPASAPLGDAPAGLPEAACSANCHIMIENRQVQVTLRGTSEAEVLARLTAVLRQYPVLPSPHAKNPRSASGETPDKGQPDWCAVHNVAMKENHKDGRIWYSHRTDQGWCKGRRPGRTPPASTAGRDFAGTIPSWD